MCHDTKIEMNCNFCIKKHHGPLKNNTCSNYDAQMYEPSLKKGVLERDDRMEATYVQIE